MDHKIAKAICESVHGPVPMHTGPGLCTWARAHVLGPGPMGGLTNGFCNFCDGGSAMDSITNGFGFGFGYSQIVIPQYSRS